MTKSKQANDIYSRWEWVDRCVWSERMLRALESGVKGGKWFSLIDKVWSPTVLEQAFGRVAANDGAPGVDGVRIEDYRRELAHYSQWLSESLKTGDYCPKPIRRHYIPKPGCSEERPLGIPCVRDRVVQTALRSVIEPIFEKNFAEGSYGFRPGRGCKDALRQVVHLLNTGHLYIVDVDLRRYFDTIPHARLLKLINSKISDGRIISLIELFLTQDVMDGLDVWTSTEGAPQGAVLSPLLSNIYLDPLDHLMAGEGYSMVRYADDFIIACTSAEQARYALERVQNWVKRNGLILHPDKTRIVDMTVENSGFDFLGYHFHRTRGNRLRCWASAKAEKNLRHSIRPLTKRCNGHSLETIIERLNPKLRGWFEYFKHGNLISMINMDRWVRVRLRSILRKRRKGKGRGRGFDHFRWPNQYFYSLGLFSLEAAHRELSQSLRGTR